MLKADAIRHFKTGMELAKQLNIDRQRVYKWPDTVPPKWAIRIERLTKGKVKMDKSLYQ